MTNTYPVFQNPFFKWIASTILVLGFIVPLMPKQASSAEIFSDVDPSNTHYPGIIEAYENGFVGGYPDGTFKPNLKLSRGNVTKALGKLVLVKSGSSLDDFDFSLATPFNDVPPTYHDRELFEYSIIVKEAGIFTGSNNNLLPQNLMTRQQMAKVLVNAFDLKHVAGKQSRVTDNHLAIAEFREYIDILSENDVTTVTNFRPGESTTRGQFATFLTNANNAAYKDVPVVPEEPEEPVPPMPEPDPLPPTPLFVKDLPPVSYSEIMIINLPTTVPVVYSDGSEKEYAVTWNKKGEDLKVGTHQLTGKVKDTEFTTQLTVHVNKFNLIPPGQTFLPIPIPTPAEYTHADGLIAKLSQDVKNAANALEASQKWALANDAVNIVKTKYPRINYSTWNNVLSAQWRLVEQRQEDINEAKKAATVAVNELLKYQRLTVVDIDAIQHKPIAELQAELAKAKNVVVGYEKLDQKANTSQLHSLLAKHQTRINDLKAVSELAFKSTIELDNVLAEYVDVIHSSPRNSDPSITIKWGYEKKNPQIFNITTRADHFIMERRYGSIWGGLEGHLWKNFTVNITKGDATARKVFTVYLPKGNLISTNPAAYFDTHKHYYYVLAEAK